MSLFYGREDGLSSAKICAFTKKRRIGGPHPVMNAQTRWSEREEVPKNSWATSEAKGRDVEMTTRAGD